jgi:hypothetical protein
VNQADRDRQWVRERGAVPELLEANRERRTAATAEVAAARDEMAALVVRGYRVALSVAEMSRMTGVSRETLHAVLREAGEPTWQEKARQ